MNGGSLFTGIIVTATARAASPAEKVAKAITATWTCQDDTDE